MRLLLSIGLVVLLISEPTLLGAAPPDRETPITTHLRAAYESRLSALFDKAQREETVRVIVQVREPSVPKELLTAIEVEKQQMDQIAAVQKAVVGRLISRFGVDQQKVRRSKYTPFFDLAVDEQMLEALRQDPDVVSIKEDELFYPLLNETGVTSRARPWFRRRVEAGWMGVGLGCSHGGAPFRFGCNGS